MAERKTAGRSPRSGASADTGQSFGPGATIGILGGGQLGRMAAMAAARLGLRSHIYCPDPDSPAMQVTPQATVAPYEDEAALKAFAEQVDVVTFEFENVPDKTAEFLAALRPTRPGPRVLHLCQDRLREKDFLNGVGVATTRYLEVTRPEALERAVRAIGRPCILKSARFGYDGKGQVRINPDTDLREAWRLMGSDLGILEALVDFTQEISVIVARSVEGQLAVYPTVENQHRNHILDVTIAPARVPDAVSMRAEAIGRHIAEAMDVVGLVAVEMFVTAAGEVLVNELAPRPHNSGHWTIDACFTSQFEQFVRAVCGLPLGSTEHHSDAVMKNLIGAEADAWRDVLSEPGAKLHLYGKTEARPGRKMGHVTRLSPRR
ncbi:MAG: N5-carboxyaminoimidazole ribonucleotide synthase [Alphaproteobacteria bacterium]|nr:MAG: N5-carboxyaminoimidazole ribonucleotide synthase [Alphaproteobacteria bacterium]